jgi:hypothetical protein
MYGLIPRGESRRLLASRPYEVARRRRGLGQRAQDAGQARASDPTTRSLRKDACVPIPTKPPVYNGMIAPRDSWMMPPVYNEMIPPGAPRVLA